MSFPDHDRADTRMKPTSQTPELLSRALEASFRGYKPYSPPVPLGEIMTKLHANFYCACPMSDAELKIIIARYAAMHGFNIGGI